MKTGWEYKKLGDISTIAAGQGAPQGDANYSTQGTPFIKAGNLIDLINGVDENDIQKVTDDVAKSHKLRLYPSGSILFAKSGMSCMKGYVYTTKNDCYVVSHLAIITPKCINSSYLNYFLQVKKPNSLVKDEAYPSISLKDISDIDIPYPSAEQQQSIVTELDTLSAIIADHKAQLKDYDALEQSIFYDMFGDPVKNDKGWEVKKLGDCCSELKYGTSRPACENGQYKYLRMGNLTLDGHLDLADLKTIDIPDDEIDKCIVKYGDILFNRTNSMELIGKTCMFDLEEPMVIAGYIIRVRLFDTLNPRFLSIMFNLPSLKLLLKSMAKGAVNQANINSKELASIRVILPPLPLQQQFASKIEAIEQMKTETKKALQEAETLFQARMDYWFN
ncbi:MAG: restriction endonuclease subunit S [Paludibacteraceae bacterium]|nr:restriction endonuclease subunit S [Paludibacteraceae bacterium]